MNENLSRESRKAAIGCTPYCIVSDTLFCETGLDYNVEKADNMKENGMELYIISNRGTGIP